MKKNRVIARLDIKGPNVVKGIQFECLRVMGKPGDIARKYYTEGADELLFLDTVANLYQRQNLIHIIDIASDNIFIPITAGGGVRTLEDIRVLLEAGADKVAINTAATKNPKLLSEAARMFGAQCIISSIEAKKYAKGKWEAYVDNGRQKTGLDVIEWAKKVETLGAGEILLTSVDMEGTETGFDVDLIREVSQAVDIPVIAAGGAGSTKDFLNCFQHTGADAVAAASVFHYGKLGVAQLKEELFSQGVKVRVNSATEEKSETLNAKQNYDIHDYNKYTLHHLANYKSSEKDEYKPKNTFVSTILNGVSDVTVVNCGINNVKSVVKAFELLGSSVSFAKRPEDIMAAKRLVIPGVGTFEHGMNNLKKHGFDKAIKDMAKKGTPILGICLGMQLLFSEGEEFGLHKGLDLIKGRVVSLEKPNEVNVKGYKLPHIGWNDLMKKFEKEEKGMLLDKIEDSAPVYFVHSFHAIAQEGSVIAITKYGGQEFCSAIRKDNIYGVQFHPEKSGEAGLAILRNFCKVNA